MTERDHECWSDRRESEQASDSAGSHQDGLTFESATQTGHEAVDQGAINEPRKEVIQRGELYFLHHPTTSDTFSGYGLTLRPGVKDFLAGLLMVDRPQPVDPEWLKEVEHTFGEYQLTAMTATGERGIACQMRIEPDSQSYLRQFPTEKVAAIEQALQPLLEEPPKPCFSLRWDAEQELWTSEMMPPFELPPELREVFERTGPGCIPSETNIGVVHVCHASDQDIDGFANQPAAYQWQLALMPTAPLLRLEVTIFDQPQNPYRFESFLNTGQEADTRIAEQLVSQEELYFAFHGEDFTHRFTKVMDHSEIQREQLQRLVDQADDHWAEIPEERRDFDLAKAAFQRHFPL